MLPARDYRQRKVATDNRPLFDALISRAAEVRQMPFTESGRPAYEAANQELITISDRLVAVWDSQPSKEQGGTGAVVEQARQLGKPVQIVWTTGAARGLSPQ